MHEIRRADIGGFQLCEIEFDPGGSVQLPRTDHPSLHFVLRGSFTDDYRRDQRICDEQTLMILPPSLSGSRRSERGALVLVVEIEPTTVEFMGLPAGFLQRVSCFVGGELSVLAQRVHQEFKLLDEQSPVAIKGLLIELLSRAARRQAAGRGPRPPACLARAEAMLRDRFAEPLKLAEIARVAGVHQVYLARVFRRFRKCSVGEYIRRLRVEYAIDRLQQSEMPLADIALQAGFADQSHFTRVFKAQTGITPARYRSAQRRLSQEPAN